MAKKYEFKQDKQGTGFWSKLYVTPNQRRYILRWALYAFVIMVLSVVQDVILCRIQVFGATTDLVPCGIILICLVEGVQRGCIFALVAALFHLFSGGAPGVYSMVFITVLAVYGSIFRESFLQEGFWAALLCCAGAMILYTMLNFAMGLFLQLTIPSRAPGFLLTAVMTLPMVPIVYPICTSIARLGGNTWKE